MQKLDEKYFRLGFERKELPLKDIIDVSKIIDINTERESYNKGLRFSEISDSFLNLDVDCEILIGKILRQRGLSDKLTAYEEVFKCFERLDKVYEEFLKTKEKFHIPSPQLQKKMEMDYVNMRRKIDRLDKLINCNFYF